MGSMTARNTTAERLADHPEPTYRVPMKTRQTIIFPARARYVTDCNQCGNTIGAGAQIAKAAGVPGRVHFDCLEPPQAATP